MAHPNESSTANPAATHDQTVHDQPIALITGANRGIGRHVAEELSADGFTVLIGSRDLEKGETTAEEIGVNARAIQLDVTDQTSIAAAAERIRTELGRLDVLVNNAGISHAGAPGRSLEEIVASGYATVASLDEVRTVFETNVFGVIAVTQAMLPLLLEAPAGRIVNVSSGLGSLTLNSDPDFPYRKNFNVVYGVSKTALNAVTVSFANELKSKNVEIHAVSPGFTATNLNNFEGEVSVEEGARNVVRMARGDGEATSLFTGPDGPLPW